MSSRRLRNSGRKWALNNRIQNVHDLFFVDRCLDCSIFSSSWSDPKIRCHDEKRIFAIDDASFAVGDASIIENLQEDIEDIVDGLFRFHRRERRHRGGVVKLL